MRRDVEFTSGGETIAAGCTAPTTARGRSRHRHGRRLVLRQGARAAPLRASCSPTPGSRRCSSTTATSAISDGHAAPAHRPQRAGRGLPERDLLRRDAGGGRRRADRRLGPLLQRRPRADRSAPTDPPREVRRSQIPVVDGYRNMRRVHGTIGFRSFEQRPARRPAATLRDRRGRHPPARGARPVDRALDLAVPGDVRDVRRAQGSARRRPTRTAARSSRPSCSCPTTSIRSCRGSSTCRRWWSSPSSDDLTLWDLEIEAYNRSRPTKKRLVVVGGSTHMTLYSDRSLLDAGGAGRHRLVHGESRGTEARWSGMIDTAEPGRVRAEKGGSA